MQFDGKQINNLLTGIILACELSGNNNQKRFITVRSFDLAANGTLLNWDNTIKSYDRGAQAYFRIHVYTVPSEYIENEYDINEDMLSENEYNEDIIGWEALYKHLSKYVTELKMFVPQWHCNNPLE